MVEALGAFDDATIGSCSADRRLELQMRAAAPFVAGDTVLTGTFFVSSAGLKVFQQEPTAFPS
jgi:hypothetical protein